MHVKIVSGVSTVVALVLIIIIITTTTTKIISSSLCDETFPSSVCDSSDAVSEI
jgi:hypothetical protein